MNFARVSKTRRTFRLSLSISLPSGKLSLSLWRSPTFLLDFGYLLGELCGGAAV